mgnify:CR=1 FL=1
MAYSVAGKLVVAISSRALFDFEEENRVFDAQGERAYIDLQYSRMDVPAKEGVAFRLVKKLLAFNSGDTQRVEVVILPKNDPVSGLRIFRSAQRAGLKIERGVELRQRIADRVDPPARGRDECAHLLRHDARDEALHVLAGLPVVPAVVPATVAPATVAPTAVVPTAIVPAAVVPTTVMPAAIMPTAVVPAIAPPGELGLWIDGDMRLGVLEAFLPGLRYRAADRL